MAPEGPDASPPPARDGVRLRTAFLVSSTGDWIYRFAVPTLVLAVTGSAVSTALAYALEMIPYIVVGALAGVIADRFDRRRILIACDSVSTVLALVLAGAATLDRPPVSLLYLLAFLLACVRPFYFPAFQGFIVDTVPAQGLSRLNAWTQTVDSALGFLGPVAGTAVIAALGVPTATLVNAMSFGVSALLIWQIGARRIRPTAAATTAGSADPAADPGTRAGIWRELLVDFMAGLRILWSIKPVWWGTVLIAAANLATFVVEGSIIYLVLEVDKLSKPAMGLVFSAQGLGAVLGALLVPKLLDRLPAGHLLVAGMGLSAATMGLPVLVPTYLGVVTGWGLEGIATSIIVVSWFTARQRVVPPEAIGRVVSVGRALAFAVVPFGAVIGGYAVTTAHPTRTLFLVAFLIQLVSFIATPLSPVARIDRAAPAEAEPSGAAAT